MNKLALGTVQFGLDYGISNTQGQVKSKEVGEILTLAKEKKIHILDTARAYGNSEEVLGKYIEKENTFNIISKLSAGVKNVSEEINQSLKNLKQNKLYAYLFHDFSDFEKKPLLWNNLKQEKENRKIKKIGFSLYYPKQIEILWQKNIQFDILQVPYNLFDRRFEPYFEKLKNQNVEIHVRSIFLQGLFFMQPEKLSKHFESVKYKINRLQQLAKENQLTLASLPLFFVIQNPNIDKAVLGVSNLNDLQENLKILENCNEIQKLNINFNLFNEENEKIILPFLWKK